MRSGSVSVVTSHPAKQVVAYDTVVALQQAGMLRRHLAAVYYDPHQFPYSLAARLPRNARSGLIRQLTKRQCADLDAGLVTSFPYVELLLRAFGSVSIARRRQWLSSSYLFVNRAHDLFAARWLARHPAPSAFMGFQGAALWSLRTARRRGSVAILNATHPLSHMAIMAEEYSRLGLVTTSKLSLRLIEEAHTADYCITASELTSKSLLDIGVSQERILELPYGVDIHHFHPPPKAADRNVFRVLFVGKLTIHKGFHYLLDAWRTLSLPNSELVLVGHPSTAQDVQLFRRYESSRFRWVREVDDIHAVYVSADVFVLPSLVEGFGMVTLEAMASGLPVIVTEHAKAVVRDGVDGYVIPIRDIDALQDRIRRMYNDPARREAMGRAARARAEEFSVDRYHTRIVQTMRGILANGRTVARTT